MGLSKPLTLLLFLLMILLFFRCNLIGGEGDVLYSKGRYTIKKKKLLSYYSASPDLLVKTNTGEVKINLNQLGDKDKIAQEKIAAVEVTEINNDSIHIHFATSGNSSVVKQQSFMLNVKHIIDSIVSEK